MNTLAAEEEDEEEEEEEDEEDEEEEEGENVRDAAVAAPATVLASVPLLSDRREAEGNAVAQTATAVGLMRRGKRGRTAATPMESNIDFMLQNREETRLEERLAREASERRHQEMMMMMMTMINQNNHRHQPLTSPYFSSDSRRTE